MTVVSGVCVVLRCVFYSFSHVFKRFSVSFALIGSLIGGADVALISGSALVVSTPAHASCLFQGTMRPDISDDDCLEAQRTNCVRHLLTPSQYRACLRASADAIRGGHICFIDGKMRNDLSELDCEEAKATGCVRHLLTPTQYQRCLDAQPQGDQARQRPGRPRRVCKIHGEPRPDISMDDCEEARATGCIRHLLTPSQYRSCLDAQEQ